MHCLVYNVPFFTKKYGKLLRFSGQGVEKINNDIKKFIIQKQTNGMQRSMPWVIFRIFVRYECHILRHFSLFSGSLLKNYITPILVRTFGVVSLITLADLYVKCSILFRTCKASTVAGTDVSVVKSIITNYSSSCIAIFCTKETNTQILCCRR
jgi:hypothetical protein